MSTTIDNRRPATGSRPAEGSSQERSSSLRVAADRSRLRWMKALQPYVILLATALVSGYLLPRINRATQDRQKELELKTNFVTEISESVSGIMLAVQFAESGYAAQTQEQFDHAYRDWETDQLVIAAKLRVHFRDPTLHKQWADFSQTVTEVYALAGTTHPQHRADRLGRLKQHLGAEQADWSTLQEVQLKAVGPEQFQKYYGAWFTLRDAVYRKHSELLRTLMASKMVMFGN